MCDPIREYEVTYKVPRPEIALDLKWRLENNLPSTAEFFGTDYFSVTLKTTDRELIVYIGIKYAVLTIYEYNIS